MRGSRGALAVVCAAGMACAVLIVSPCRTSRDPDRAVESLAPDYYDPDPAVRQHVVRTAARDRVARELVAGRLSLPDAAARFGWLNALPLTSRTHPRGHLAALAGLPADEEYEEGEVLALQVVAWLGRPVLSDDPARAQEAALRQFRDARAEGRLARLPELSEDDRARLLAQAEADANALHLRRTGD
jgi:hypothetical protein